MARSFEYGDGLALIGSLYVFKGAVRAPSQVDIDGPVQIVHDVSRIVERASGKVLPQGTRSGGGWVNTTTRLEVAVDAQNVYDSFTLTEVLTAAAGSEADLTNLRAWLFSISARHHPSFVSPIAQAVANEGATEVGSAVGSASCNELLFYGAADGETISAGNTAEPFRGGTCPMVQVPLPRSCVNQIDLTARCTSGGAASRYVTFNFLWWIGAVGTTPPSMA